MGQCTEALKNKLWGLSMFQSIKDNNDEIWFICVIKEVAFKFEAPDNIYVYLCKTNKITDNTYQNHNNAVK